MHWIAPSEKDTDNAALENVGGDIVDMHVSAGGNVLLGEADDLAVFANRFAFGNSAERELMAQPNAAGDFQPVNLTLSSSTDTAGNSWTVTPAAGGGYTVSDTRNSRRSANRRRR